MWRWRGALQEEGLHGEALDNALARLREAIDTTLADSEGGRWILDSGHRDARSEWALTCVGERFRADDREKDLDTPGNLIIDRCFIDRDSGERWIVDYKTSGPLEGESEQAFVDKEGATYRDQLRRYREAVSELGDEPIRCALYFTSLGRLHELQDLGT
jgi:ATP-dependent exoDNAse (exonuclease V) beta subunit